MMTAEDYAFRIIPARRGLAATCHGHVVPSTKLEVIDGNVVLTIPAGLCLWGEDDKLRDLMKPGAFEVIPTPAGHRV